MNKNEVEQLLIIVKSGQDEALNMKIYKNGLICRRGCGGLPQINTSGMCFTENAEIFDKLMEKVPQEILENPVNYQDENIIAPLEYIVAFFGVSKNGDTGERAEWEKSTGLRFLLDNNSSFRHPLLSIIDGIAIEATKLTNSWYFDIMIMALHKLKSNALPDKTIITTPKTEKEIEEDFKNYIKQTDKTELTTFPNNKLYLDKSNLEHKLILNISNNSIHYDFLPIGMKGFKSAGFKDSSKKPKIEKEAPTQTKPKTVQNNLTSDIVKNEKKWWKFW